MRNKKLDDLEPSFLLTVCKFLGKLVEAGISITIVETKRTEEQHQEDLNSGHSWIKHSKHQDGLAIDVAPFEVYMLHGDDKLQWDASDSIWQKIGQIGESVGLVWGGRWTKRDMGHFEAKS